MIGSTITELGFTSHRERFIALAVAIFMLAATIAILPLVATQADVAPSFPIIVNTIRIVATLTTAYILTLNWRILRQAPHAILANGYFFAGIGTLAQMTIILKASHTAGWISQTPEALFWLGISWHIVFCLYTALYTTMQRQWLNLQPVIVNTFAWGTIGLFIAIVATINNFTDNAPGFLDQATGLDMATTIMQITFYITILCCAFLVIATRLRNHQDLWLSITLYAFSLEMLLQSRCIDEYTTGWYAGQFLGLIGSLLMMIVFVRGSTLANQRLFEKNSHLNQLALSDPLTGLANRRCFDEQLDILCRHVGRDKVPCTLLMIDIDHFKAYNDAMGHPAGDECLKAIGSTLKTVVWRPLDIVARIGGEEFAVILPGTDEQGATVLATRIMQAIRRLNIVRPFTNGQIVTVSIGGATLGERFGNNIPKRLIMAADHALYSAKNNGRNQFLFNREYNSPIGRQA